MNAWQKYRQYRTAVAAVEPINAEYAAPECYTAAQSAWHAMPLWLRVGLCLRCHWVDAVFEIHPPLGRWLVERRGGRR